MNQQDHDRRSLAWHRHVLARVRGEDGQQVLTRARATLERWRSEGPRRDDPYLAQWARALDAGVDAVERLALQDSDAGCALRQSSPVACALPAAERWAWRREWERSRHAP